ncbi:MAG: ABC transporter permease [Kastovskya adunca ATA6-11-RM4]|jgi:ABC-2 type transport system permease protein|nr:ABC transporter permease [Kastovskya adunca ATA6-11-RM4]
MFELFLAEFRRSWIQFIRYPVEVIGGIFITTSIFYGLFLSASYIAGPTLQFGDRLDAIVVGYVLWNLVLFIMNDIALGLQYESQTGTLEQIFLSPFGAPIVFLMRALASLVLRLGLTFSVLLIIMVLTGSRLVFPPAIILPLITVLLGAYGLAFAMGSLALLLKRVQQLLGIFQFALLFLMAVPTETWVGSLRVISWFLPMTSGAGLLRGLMARGEALNLLAFALALANGMAYFVLGLLIFQVCEREAKRRGMLSGY